MIVCRIDQVAHALACGGWLRQGAMSSRPTPRKLKHAPRKPLVQLACQCYRVMNGDILPAPPAALAPRRARHLHHLAASRLAPRAIPPAKGSFPWQAELRGERAVKPPGDEDVLPGGVPVRQAALVECHHS